MIIPLKTFIAILGILDWPALLTWRARIFSLLFARIDGFMSTPHLKSGSLWAISLCWSDFELCSASLKVMWVRVLLCSSCLMSYFSFLQVSITICSKRMDIALLCPYIEMCVWHCGISMPESYSFGWPKPTLSIQIITDSLTSTSSTQSGTRSKTLNMKIYSPKTYRLKGELILPIGKQHYSVIAGNLTMLMWMRSSLSTRREIQATRRQASKPNIPPLPHNISIAQKNWLLSMELNHTFFRLAYIRLPSHSSKLSPVHPSTIPTIPWVA